MEINKCFYCMEDMPSNTAACPRCGKRPGEIPQPEFALPMGTILHGKYLIGAVLGQGGFGLTYIGFDLMLGTKVAVKEYYPSHSAARSRSGNVLWSTRGIPKETGCENFLKEARKMAKLKDIPQVVRVQDIVMENDTAYIVMDFVEGITLKEKLKKGGVMPAEQVLSLLGPVASALDQVHGDGIIHRDISPDNIMLDRNGKAKLLDLGAAKEIDMRSDSGQQSSQIIHKDGFSPPEQYTSGGNIGPWTDVYALAATVFYCLTGKLVPSAMDRMYNQIPVPFPAGFPENIRKTLEKGLAPKAEDRYRTAGELWAALEKAGPVPEPPVPPKPKRYIGILAVCALLAAAAIAAGIIFVRHLIAVKDTAAAELPVSTAARITDDSDEEDLSGDEETDADDEADRESGESGDDEEAAADDEDETVDYAGDFRGLWKYDSYTNTFLIAPSGYVVEFTKNTIECVGWIADNDGTTLTIGLCGEDGDDIYVDMTLNEDGTLSDNDGDTLSPCSPGSFESTASDGCVGVWEYDDYWVWFQLNNGMWAMYTRDDIITRCGYYTDNGDGTVSLHNMFADSDWYTLTYDADTDTMTDSNDHGMFRSVSPLYSGEVSITSDTSGSSSAVGSSAAVGTLYAGDCENWYDMTYDEYTDGKNLAVFGSQSLTRDQILSIEFVSNENLPAACSGGNVAAWDVSEEQDGAVTAYAVPADDADMYDLYIAADGAIKLSEDANHIFASFTEVQSITFNGMLDTSDTKNMNSMFWNCENLTGVDLGGFDTAEVTDMGSMFGNCKKLTSLDVSGFDTSNVTNMSAMFQICENLTSLDVSGFDTSNVIYINSMFIYCENLTELDVSGFDTANVTNMSSMFGICKNLTELDVSGFDTSKVTNMNGMFQDCEELTSLDVSGFDTSNVESMSWMFCDCHNLTTLDVSGFDTSNLVSSEDMFTRCDSLQNVDTSKFDISADK